MSHQAHLVVVGSGLAAMRTLDQLLATGKNPYRITLITQDTNPAYNRVLLSSWLAGEKAFAELVTHDDEWYERHGINLFSGVKVLCILPDQKNMQLSNGICLGYDKLILATGSQPFIPLYPNGNHPKVITFREKSDVDKMLEHCHQKEKIVVVGGGFLGLEAAHGMCMRGGQVTLVHNTDFLLNRQIDKNAGGLLLKHMRHIGIDFHLNAEIEKIALTACRENLLGVQLKDGTHLPADLVVMALGIRPNVGLAKEAGILVNRAIVVSDQMQTSKPDIYAVGECVEHNDLLFGVVAPIFDQAHVLAQHLVNHPAAFQPKPLVTSLKVKGIQLYSAGQLKHPDAEHLYFHDQAKQTYKHLLIHDDQLVGAILYGDTQDSAYYSDLIHQKHSIAGIRQQLIFGDSKAQVA